MTCKCDRCSRRDDAIGQVCFAVIYHAMSSHSGLSHANRLGGRFTLLLYCMMVGPVEKLSMQTGRH